MKKCIQCKEEKKDSEFYKRNDTGKLRRQCKSCLSKNMKSYRKFNWAFVVKRKLKWQKENKEKRAKISRKYYLKHKDEIRIYHREYMRSRPLEVRLKMNYRGRIWKALNRGDRSYRTIELLGCSIERLKKHLEKQFKPNMEWENYGEWHIDHIKPCVKFDLTKEEEIKKCFNYKNLQPLWKYENQSKGYKYLE